MSDWAWIRGARNDYSFSLFLNGIAKEFHNKREWDFFDHQSSVPVGYFLYSHTGATFLRTDEVRNVHVPFKCKVLFTKFIWIMRKSSLCQMFVSVKPVDYPAPFAGLYVLSLGRCCTFKFARVFLLLAELFFNFSCILREITIATCKSYWLNNLVGTLWVLTHLTLHILG